MPDHHVFVSLGCATENLIHAALAHGLQAEARFGAARDALRVTLEPTSARASPLFNAIASRQCTRGDYDGQPLSNEELGLLERAGTSSAVRVLLLLLLLRERPAMERVLDHVLQANTAQIADPTFVKELKAWIRFIGADAVRTVSAVFSSSLNSMDPLSVTRDDELDAPVPSARRSRRKASTPPRRTSGPRRR